jgi:signal transduction histidine kinase
MVSRADAAGLGAGDAHSLAAAVLVLLQAAVIAGLLFDRRRRRGAARSLAERLRFETLLSSLSMRLVPVSLHDVDAEIEAGLQQVAGFLGMDRASLDEHAPGGAVARISWGAQEAGKLMPVIEPDRFPWSAGRLQAGKIVRFSRLDELPAEAALDLRSYEQAGTSSYLALALGAGGAMLGTLSFDTARGGGAWPDELAARLELLGTVFAGALDRKRQELSRAERLRFETLLSEQSATFSGLPPGEVDHEIERALRRIADFFQADWGSLAEFSQDSRMARITHSWVADGAAPAPAAVSLAEIPWTTSRWQSGAVVRFSRIEDLPDREAAADRLTYARLGIRAQVAAPLKMGGALLGALAFSALGAARVWPDELVPRLLLLGEVFASILARRHAEIEAQRLRRELSHVGRVSTMGALTTSLAHELNQPLTAILSNAQAAQRLLGADPVQVDKIREILKAIVADDRRAGEVIHRLRGLLRRGRVELSVVDVNDVVAEVARLVRGEAVLQGVVVRIELEPGLPPVTGDRVELQQVVLNLILNGLDAMHEPDTRPRALALRTETVDATVRVVVRDSGTGIDPADLEHIFDAFYTTKADGLGMGLAIARSIVEDHGGRLDARNNPDGGAMLFFTLPIATPAP